jgi:hypothetical protein
MPFEFLKDKTVESEYIGAAATVGNALSYYYLGEPVNMKQLVRDWKVWEEEYARRGFRTIDLGRLVNYGGYGETLDDVVGQKRLFDEEPIYHAKLYETECLGKLKPLFDLREV